MTTTATATDMFTLGTTPPAPGTHLVEWEGYARADEIRPGDEIVPLGVVTLTHRVDESRYAIATADEADVYENDVALYIVRKVKVTVEEA